MSKTENLESLNKISTTVSARDKKIWENETRSVCIKKATEEWQNKIKQLEENLVNLQKENPILEKRLSEISSSIELQKNALKTSEKSLLVHKSLKEKLIQERDEMRKNYANVLQMYEDEYQDYRAIYIKRSKGFKDLNEKEIRLKKSKIEGMDLDVKIKNVKKTIHQFQTIQNQILQANIIKFAKFYQAYHKNEKIHSQLLQMKNEEKQLMKEHLELVKRVKEKQQAKAVQEREQRQILNSRSDGNSSETKKKDSKEPEDLTHDRLRKFLLEDIKPISLTSLDYSSQQPLFSHENSKVRVLDMKVVRQPSLQKPNFDLRKKMKTIMETARKSVVRTNSRQTSPTKSQPSQNENVSVEKKLSQSSQEKPSTPKEDIQINPILKQKKEEQVKTELMEKTVKPVDENISKFFNNKKKSVTFQNETTLKTSQEDKRETEKKFSLVNNNKENDKSGSSTGFSFGFNIENVKSVELKSVDIFRKPFSFTNENKKSGFGRVGSEENKPDPAPETTTTGNVSFTTPFTATESTAKTSEESSYDPFEASFNRSNFGQSLNVAEEFEQPPESNTFNFFGSQNKNNLFTMF